MDNIPAGKITTNNEVPSPKKTHNPIGIQSQWSPGWTSGDNTIYSKANNSKGNHDSNIGFGIYHNQSNVLLGDSQLSSKQEEQKGNKRVNVESTKPVWNYDPKNAGKSTFSFGDEKPDYRKKD